MEAYESEIHQVFVKLLDGKHKILNFNVPSISVFALKNRIQTLTAIPSHLQLLLVDNSRVLYDHRSLNLSKSRGNLSFPEALGTDSDSQLIRDREVSGFRVDLAEEPVGSDVSGKFPVVVQLLLRLRGGKGGFGSLLRGAATKAGQKKTNNFDACRDMNGRRLRHVNAEKKLEEWRAEAEERKLEKMADDFIKKKSKEVLKSGKGKGGDSAEKYVAKYREDSAKCMEEVERSVRESIKGLSSSKRKIQAEGSGSTTKRLKIWMGKRKLGDSDSEDPDEDGSDEEEEENEKYVIIDGGSHSDSSKEVEASSGSNSGGKPSGSADQGSSGNASEEENAEESFKSVKSLHESCENGNTKLEHSPMPATLEETKECTEIAPQIPGKSHLSPVIDVVSQQPETCVQDDIILSAAEVKDSSKSESVVEESVSMSESFENLDKPLNFDDHHSATELEVLGLERLKSELQSRGLKCGGTLQERAIRLFLLKTTPLEKLPKKLFAKK